jgi:hypothetical protein
VCRERGDRNSIVDHDATRAHARPRAAPGRLEKTLAEPAARFHDRAPQLALLDIAEHAQRRRPRRIAVCMQLEQPAAEIATRGVGQTSRPRIAVSALDASNSAAASSAFGARTVWPAATAAIRPAALTAGLRLAGARPRLQRRRRGLRRAIPRSARTPCAAPAARARFVMRKQLRYGTLKLTPGATSTCLFSSKSSAKALIVEVRQHVGSNLDE